MLLKKAGMVVLGAAAGVAALSGTAFAGDMPTSTSHDHGHHHHHDRDDENVGGDTNPDEPGNGNASASNGDCANFGDQLVGLNCVNVQAPINQLGLLSDYDNSSIGGGSNGNARVGGDSTGGGNGNSSARNGDSVNFGDQLIGANGLNVQAPINQLGVLSRYDNSSLL
jgi:hypothetical protein